MVGRSRKMKGGTESIRIIEGSPSFQAYVLGKEVRIYLNDSDFEKRIVFTSPTGILNDFNSNFVKIGTDGSKYYLVWSKSPLNIGNNFTVGLDTDNSLKNLTLFKYQIPINRSEGMDTNTIIELLKNARTQGQLSIDNLQINTVQNGMQNTFLNNGQYNSAQKLTQTIISLTNVQWIGDSQPSPSEEIPPPPIGGKRKPLTKCTVAELKAKCKSRGLKVSGTKDQLITRLRNKKKA